MEEDALDRGNTQREWGKNMAALINTFLVGFLCATLIWGCYFIYTGTKDSVWNAEAVKHGAAIWTAAPDGSVEFKWKDELGNAEER